MNSYYDEDAATTQLASFVARAAQEGSEYQTNLWQLQVKNYAIEQFQEPPCLRVVNNWEDGDGEAIFRVIGILCRHTLPPVKEQPRMKSSFAVRHLRQAASITGLGSQVFEEATSALDAILQAYVDRFPQKNVTMSGLDRYEGHLSLTAHNRYFTERHLVPNDRHVPFNENVDPFRILEHLRGPNLVHVDDNEVEYSQKVMLDALPPKYEPVDPSIFNEGDIVEISVAMVAVETSSSNVKLFPQLKGIALLSDEVRKESERCKERHTYSLATLGTVPMKSQPRKLKRRRLYGDVGTRDGSPSGPVVAMGI